MQRVILGMEEEIYRFLILRICGAASAGAGAGIAYLSGYSIKESGHEKYENFRDAMETQGLPAVPDPIVDGEPPFVADMDAGYHAMSQLLGRTRDFTAVFAVNDLVAVGAMKALREQGLRVPEDVSVVGCDNIQFSSYMEPQLAAIRVPKAEMGRLAAGMNKETISANGNNRHDNITR